MQAAETTTWSIVLKIRLTHILFDDDENTGKVFLCEIDMDDAPFIDLIHLNKDWDLWCGEMNYTVN